MLKGSNPAFDKQALSQKRADEAEIKLEIKFNNKDLLASALVHRSYAHEARAAGLKIHDNERLEFLGDAVIGLFIAESLYGRYPDMPEGEMAKLRANLVNREMLAEVAVEIGLDKLLLLGKGAEMSGGRERDSILAGCFEALVGAYYLDKGYEKNMPFLQRVFEKLIEVKGSVPVEGFADAKTRLQEYCAKRWGQLPRYKVIKQTGPDHDRIFNMQAETPDGKRFVGSGASKKKAEQEAAKKALESLGNIK